MVTEADSDRRFEPPLETVVCWTQHWLLSHRVDAWLPGYLVVTARDDEAPELEALSREALLEIGPVLARTTRLLKRTLGADQVQVIRWGPEAGFPVHFHVIPIYPWVYEVFDEQARPEDPPPDGLDLALFVWRDYCESPDPPTVRGPGREEAVRRLRRAFRGEDTEPDGEHRTGPPADENSTD